MAIVAITVENMTIRVETIDTPTSAAIVAGWALDDVKILAIVRAGAPVRVKVEPAEA